MNLVRRSRPITISDAPEHRAIPLDRVELRASEDDNEFILEGYASTFDEYEMYGGPANYGWIERIDPGAFAVTLREKPDLHLLVNHQGTPLARTKSGTCDLAVDDHGLKVTARLDKRDPESMALYVKMDRGDMDEMSFAFRVKAQEWRAAEGFEDIDDESYRTITEVSLHKGDVSVVNWGANPNTSASVKLSATEALRALSEADEDELAEIRSDSNVLPVVRKLVDGSVLGEAIEIAEKRIGDDVSDDPEDLTDERACATCTCGAAEEVEEEDDEVEEAEDEPIVEFLGIRNNLPIAKAGAEAGEELAEALSEEPVGMSLRSALALQGELAEGDGTLSLEAALALQK